MRAFIGLGAVAMVLVSTAATAQVRVRGHIRSDGTYVAPHVRSAPNRSTMDNWSTSPNVNPYNGRQGTVDPYRTPTAPTYQPPRSSSYSNPYAVKPYTPPCYFNCGD